MGEIILKYVIHFIVVTKWVIDMKRRYNMIRAVAMAAAVYAGAGETETLNVAVLPLNERIAVVAKQLQRYDDNGRYVDKRMAGLSLRVADGVSVAVFPYEEWQRGQLDTQIVTGEFGLSKKLGRLQLSGLGGIEYDLDMHEVAQYRVLLKAGLPIEYRGFVIMPYVSNFAQWNIDRELVENAPPVGLSLSKKGIPLELSVENGSRHWHAGSRADDSYTGVSLKLNVGKAMDFLRKPSSHGKRRR
ncbi:MAG: hypothetical protein KJ601_03345 [Nanoarchaeota archaeon]|nr:hypothetical protein [Nanoarchaeota archaeon]MBU1704870.1 hypothetical protein [Nanoarchaeota archaeon]